MERVIMLIDCQSFYASVEKAAHPEYKNDPVVVAGDPSRRSGIILVRLSACEAVRRYNRRDTWRGAWQMSASCHY